MHIDAHRHIEMYISENKLLSYEFQIFINTFKFLLITLFVYDFTLTKGFNKLTKLALNL